MSTRKEMLEEAALFSRVPQKPKRQNNKMTLRHLLEEAFEMDQLTHEFWGEVERENGECSPGWEDKWIPIR